MQDRPPITPLTRTSGIHSRIYQLAQVISEKDVDEIHAASLSILAKVGIRIDNHEALNLLRSAGASADGAIVHIPERVVEKAIVSAPNKVTLFARDPEKNVYLGEGNVHFTSGFGSTWVRDLDTGHVRMATLDDLAVFTRLADALELVHVVLFPVVPQDIPPKLLDVASTAVVLQNTSKHVQLSLEGAGQLDQVFNIARIIAGPGNPLPISAGGVPNSPLHYTEDVMTKFIALARNQIPCFIVSGGMAGATAPVTLAGLLALQNAEVLAGVVINQLANPGAPVIYGTFSGGFDMRSTKLALGGPESALITCATQQLSKRYGIPLGYATGGVTDSPSRDIQAGIEKTFSILAACLSGVDVIHDGISGLFAAGMLTSLDQMVIDHDICNTARYYLNGIPISRETIAEELIANVGPGGAFLTTEHTANNFREALFLEPMRARNMQFEDTDGNRSTYSENAARRAKKILSNHQPLGISDEQHIKIDAIVKETRLSIEA